MEHWLTDDHEACKHAISLDDLAKIAIRMLKRYKVEIGGETIHQICGPMSTGGFGTLNRNMEFFKYAITVARESTWYVFNQIPFQEAMIRIVRYGNRKDYAQEILDHSYAPLFESGVIGCAVFLPNFTTSKGAQWEWKKVQECSINYKMYPAAWYAETLRRYRMATG